MTKNQSPADTSSIVRPDGGCGFRNTLLLKGDELHVEVVMFAISVLDTGWSWLS
jgi:hypothetical protein